MTSALAELPVVVWTDVERELLTPPQRDSVWKWADDNLYLPDGDSAYGGRFRSSATPYVREIMDWYLDPECRCIVAMWGAQLGKTTMMLGLTCFGVGANPGPIMWAMPTGQDLTYMHERLVGIMERSPEVVRHLTGRSEDVTQEGISYDRGRVFYATAGAQRTMKSRPVRDVFKDETVEWKNGKQAAAKLAMRQKTYISRGAFTFDSSTPDHPQDAIHSEHESSTKYDYHVPCPGCGGYQILTWENVKWEGGRDDVDLAVETARYACSFCGELWDDVMRADAIDQGKWVQEHATIDNDGTITGTMPARRRGTHLPTMAAKDVPLGECVRNFIELDIGEFTRQVLGLPYGDQVDAVREDQLTAAIGDYERNEIPEGVQFLTAGVDVQGERLGFFLVVRGWGEGGESWLIRASQVKTWETVEEQTVLAEYGEEGMPVTWTFIDSGDGNRVDEVYDICRKYMDRCAPSKGRDRMDEMLKTSLIERTSITGAVMRTGLRLWSMNLMTFKDMLAKLIAGVGAPWHIHANTEGVLNDYFKHMRSEHKVHQGGGKLAWEVKPGSVRNDLWDAEVMALAAWHKTLGRDGKVRKRISIKARRPEKESSQPVPAKPEQTGQSSAGKVSVDTTLGMSKELENSRRGALRSSSRGGRRRGSSGDGWSDIQ